MMISLSDELILNITKEKKGKVYKTGAERPF